MSLSDFDSEKMCKCDQSPEQQCYYIPYMPYMPGNMPMQQFPTGLPLGPQTSPMPYSPQIFQQPAVMPPTQGIMPPMQGIMPPMQGIIPPMQNPLPQTPGSTVTNPPLFSGEAPGQTVMDTDFTAGYLRTLIGRIMVVEFLIGTNTFTDRSGQLVKVGASYIVLRDVVSGSKTMCDLYSIKFVRIYR